MYKKTMALLAVTLIANTSFAAPNLFCKKWERKVNGMQLALDMKDSTIEVKTNKISSLESKVEKTEGSLNLCESDVAQKSKEISSIQEDKQKLKTELEALKSEVAQLDKIKSSLSILSKSVGELHTELFVNRTAPALEGPFGNEQGLTINNVKIIVASGAIAFHVAIEVNGNKVEISDYDFNTEEGQKTAIKIFKDLALKNILK